MGVYNINFSLKINKQAITVVAKCSITIINKITEEEEETKAIIIIENNSERFSKCNLKSNYNQNDNLNIYKYIVSTLNYRNIGN